MNVLQPDERSRPRDAAMGRVQDADLRFFVGQHRVDHLRADLLPCRAARAEVILDHPLDERLAHDGRAVVETGRGLHALAHVRRGARRDAVDHRIRTRRVRDHPVAQRGFAAQLQEFEHAGLEAVAVAAQVVAVLQRELAGVLLHARVEDRGERAVDGRARAFQVGGDVGICGVQLVVFVEVIAAFGHGERHDLAFGRGARGDERIQIGGPRHDLRDRADGFVGALALRRHGFERVGAVLCRERFEHRVHVAANIADGERPARVARLDQPVQIPRLMRTMKRSRADVQDHVGGCVAFASHVCRPLI